MYCDSFPLIKFAVALQQLTCKGITFWNFFVLPGSSDHKDKVFVDSWYLAGSAGGLRTREGACPGTCHLLVTTGLTGFQGK